MLEVVVPAGLLGPCQEPINSLPQGLDGLGDPHLDPGAGQELDDRPFRRRLLDHAGEEREQRSGGITVGRQCGHLAGEPLQQVLHDGPEQREYQDAIAIAHALGQLPTLLASASASQPKPAAG